MDEAIRDLERRAAADPQAWPLLARARLRAGAPPHEVLAAVRGGLRSDPASPELARIRDEALSLFWTAPAWRPLFEREGTGGERVVFSPDGSLVAAAGRGVVVLDVEQNRIVGAGYAGRPVRAFAFLGRELLLDDEGLAHWDPASSRERARVPGTVPTIALAVSPDATRGFAVTENGRIVRLRFERGRVVGRELVLTLVPPPIAVVGWIGPSSAEDGLIVGGATGIVRRSGHAFEVEQPLVPPHLLPSVGLFPGLASTAFTHLVGRGALAPDHRAAILQGRDGPLLVRLTDESRSARTIDSAPSELQASAFSPCGSRIAILQESRLILLEAR